MIFRVRSVWSVDGRDRWGVDGGDCHAGRQCLNCCELLSVGAAAARGRGGRATCTAGVYTGPEVAFAVLHCNFAT